MGGGAEGGGDPGVDALLEAYRQWAQAVSDALAEWAEKFRPIIDEWYDECWPRWYEDDIGCGDEEQWDVFI